MMEVTAPPSVARIMYASQSNVQGSVYAEMERIRAAAVRHNEPVGVCTALLYQSGWFVQWKEGRRNALLEIMDRVEADPRHHSLRMIHSSRGPRLLAGPWSMAIVQSSETPAEMERRVIEVQHAMERGVQWSPPAIWRRLSKPMQLPDAERSDGSDAYQRILVCAAAGEESFSLVRWLAQQYDQAVVHRRFAGAQAQDVGTDYVDFIVDKQVTRVIAMARRGLTVPLTRAFLPDYSHVVLLLCGDMARDYALLQRVGHACAGLVAPPTIVGVAANAPTHQGMFTLARSLGLIYLDVVAQPRGDGALWKALAPQLQAKRDAANSVWPVVPLRRAV